MPHADGAAPSAQGIVGEISFALRAKGFLATTSRELVGFWIFDLSASHPDPPDTQQTTIAKILGHHNFKLLKSGILASQQLRAVARDTSTTQAPLNGQRPRETGSGILHVYRAFILAVSTSLLYPMVSSGDWVHFGNDSILRVYQDPIAWATMETSVERLCIDIRWSPSGTLTISSRLRPVLPVLQLADGLDNGQDVHRRAFENGARVLILPFGTLGKLLGTESQLLGAIDDDRPFKASTRASLQNIGVPTNQGSFWVYLEIQQKIPCGQAFSNSVAACHVWWPDHLCFIKHVENRQTEAETLENIVSGAFIDPLDGAEQWFLGRQERQNIIEARTKEIEKMKLQDNQAREYEDSESDGDVADAVIQANQYLSAQEASGIYPTPPDGFTSTTQGFVATQDTPGASITGGHTYHAGLGEATPDMESPGLAMSGVPLSRAENQDLFGDLDTDMFDTHGLTEADFNFFDEPDHVDEMQAESAGLDGQDAEDLMIEIGDNNDIPSHDALSEKTPLEPIEEMQIAEEQNVKHYDSPNGDMPLNDPLTIMHPSEDASVIERQAVGFSPGRLYPQMLESQSADHGEAYGSSELSVSDSRSGSFNRKYGQAGKYAASSPEAKHGSRPTESGKNHKQTIPSLGLLHKRSPDSSQDSDSNGSDSPLTSIALLDYRKGSIDAEDAGISCATSNVADVDVDVATGQDEMRKRKREPSAGDDAPATPTSVSQSQPDGEFPTDLDWCIEHGYLECNALSDLADLYKDEDVPKSHVYIGSGRGFIELAQVVADQVIHQTDSLRNVPHSMEKDDHPPISAPHSAFGVPFEILSKTFPGIQQCDLGSFLELDPNATNGASETPIVMREEVEKRRSALLRARGIDGRRKVIFEMQTPHLGIRRGQDSMDIAPPALYFWEELGLGPSQGSRNVEPFCIYADNAAIRDAATAFLKIMENSYQSCKFGLHPPAVDSEEAQNRLLPITITSVKLESISSSFGDVWETLENELRLKEADGTSIVVYLIAPVKDDTAYPYLCAAFKRLEDAYVFSAQKAGLSHPRRMVLQIVPLVFVASDECLIIPPPKAYTRLAFEVYSRCQQASRGDGTMPAPFSSGSAIRFGKPLPKAINFQLSSQPSGSILGPDPCLHLAYSWDIDQQWLACAWTDSLGTTQWNAMYCLGDPNPDYWTAFADTVKEVLDTTKDLFQPTTMPWRLYIVKDDNIRSRELDIWRLHSALINRQQNTIHFVSIDTDPPLSFPAGQTNTLTGLSASPLNTSSAAITANEQPLTPSQPSPNVNNTPSGGGQNAPATPSASGFLENDPSARLVDIVSQTWAILSPIPTIDPYRPKDDIAPMLTSGYLLKRAAAEDDDGIITLGVNLVTSINPKGEVSNHQAHVKTMSEVLEIYGDLATLARLRGLEEWSSGILPWHVAAARKAKKTVTRSMRWGEKE
ncbi:MAG: hypothetical protein Q9169_006155 [Polycauliona sp. 2 TL-2023]